MRTDRFSITGKHHISKGIDSQDSICADVKGGTGVISLADGVSTCSEAAHGAVIAARATAELLFSKRGVFFDFDEMETAGLIMSQVLYKLKQTAEKNGHDINEYSSTLAAVLADTKRGRAYLFSLGDSMILGIKDGRCRILSETESSTDGVCVTTTKGALSAVSVWTISLESIDSFIICSDGAWREMFENNDLKDTVAEIFKADGYDRLKEYLSECEPFDDCSFVSLDMNGGRI